VWRSFHKAAERTIEENTQVPVRSRRHRPPQDQREGVRAAPKQGVKVPTGAGIAPEPFFLRKKPHFGVVRI